MGEREESRFPIVRLKNPEAVSAVRFKSNRSNGTAT